MSAEVDALIRAERAYKRASDAKLAARLAREDAIRNAAKTMSMRQIAQHVSLTAQRVQQLVAAGK